LTDCKKCDAVSAATVRNSKSQDLKHPSQTYSITLFTAYQKQAYREIFS
jgi:hypothetical protein